jgi:hypothetical protein
MKKWVNYVPLSGCPGIQARALSRRRGASLKRSTTKDRNPVARVIGVSSWVAAPQDFEMARAAPGDTNAAYGGRSRSRPVISASAAPSGEAIILVVVCRRSSVLTVTGWLSPKARAGAITGRSVRRPP